MKSQPARTNALTAPIPRWTVESAEAELQEEFGRQTATLIRKRHHTLAGLTSEALLRSIEPLRDKLAACTAAADVRGEGHTPFVIVIPGSVLDAEAAMPLVELGGKPGFAQMTPVEAGQFQPIDGVRVPRGMAYLVFDIDTGRETLNVTPDAALAAIMTSGRSPLTIDEGVALVTHYPELLKTKNCFSMLGSRCGDRRVTALWISGGRPRLGWCWAGNPHTWLGSASCAGRVGA